MGGIYGGRGEGQKLAQMSLNKSMLKRTFISLQENIQNYMKNRFIIIIIIIVIIIIIIIIVIVIIIIIIVIITSSVIILIIIVLNN